MTSLTDNDQAIVQSIVAAACAAGPLAVARAIRIHERGLAGLLDQRRFLEAETQANERAIAMREWALIHLHANPEGAT